MSFSSPRQVKLHKVEAYEQGVVGKAMALQILHCFCATFVWLLVQKSHQVGGRSLLGRRPSLLGCRPSLLGWRPSLLGWRPSVQLSRSNILRWSFACFLDSACFLCLQFFLVSKGCWYPLHCYDHQEATSSSWQYY